MGAYLTVSIIGVSIWYCRVAGGRRCGWLGSTNVVWTTNWIIIWYKAYNKNLKESADEINNILNYNAECLENVPTTVKQTFVSVGI